jgi:uncharacterized protein (DUF433 family)
LNLLTSLAYQTMLLVPEAALIPLHTDPQGVIRVGKTRVTLDTVVTAFLEGASAEEIREQYSSLDLSDIYAVISCYLRNQAEVDGYLSTRQNDAAERRQAAEQRFSPVGIRDRLLSRRTHKYL